MRKTIPFSSNIPYAAFLFHSAAQANNARPKPQRETTCCYSGNPGYYVMAELMCEDQRIREEEKSDD
jgi:hypothetical protein